MSDNKNRNNAKKNNKISAYDFEKAVMSAYKGFTDLEWNGLTIRVRRTLSLEYMLIFVDYVVKSCFDSDTGEYLPEVQDFLIRSALIKFYTNITLPDDTAKQCKLLYGTSLLSDIFNSGAIDGEQFRVLVTAINEKLQIMADTKANELSKQFSDAAAGFADLLEQFGAIFDGIDVGDVGKIADAIANGDFDEEKLAGAIMKAHAPEKAMDDNEVDTKVIHLQDINEE